MRDLQASVRPGSPIGFDPSWLGVGLAAILIVPLIALGGLAVMGDGAYLSHIASTRLADFASSSFLLAAMSGFGAAMLGLGSAWLVSRYDFWGRDMLDWALVMPLAMPGYIAAYSWYDLTAPGGYAYRTTDGLFPTISGVSGAAFVFALTLYPYIYLLVRNVLGLNGEAHREIARSLGARPAQLFWRIDLPTVWPAIAAGTALVIMEVLADFGVADFLGVSTFTVGIVRAWSSFGDPAAAAQLAVILLFVCLLAMGAERAARGRRKFGTTVVQKGKRTRQRLAGWQQAAAISAAVTPLVLGLFIPLGNLAYMLWEVPPARSALGPALGTFQLSIASAAIAIIVGISAGYALRTGKSISRSAVRIAQAGYAVPGAVAGIAVLACMVALQWAIDALPGQAPVLLTGGSVFALLFAYQVRFAAVAILPCETALTRIRVSQDEIARSLGARPWEVLTKVHFPLIRTGVAVAALLVAVEVSKELPATMILRPFDLDTLAVTAHNYASDERLAQAALPSLLLLLITIPATLLLNVLRVSEK